MAWTVVFACVETQFGVDGQGGSMRARSSGNMRTILFQTHESSSARNHDGNVALLKLWSGWWRMHRSQIVHSNPEILGGTPVFVGTRVPVQTLLVYLEKDETLEEFLDNFPTVSREQAVAFLEEAAHYSRKLREERSQLIRAMIRRMRDWIPRSRIPRILR